MKTGRYTDDRAGDERLLQMLALRDRGLNSPQIGARFGLTQHAVRTTLQRIDRDTAEAEG
jgi:hypothetical protein